MARGCLTSLDFFTIFAVNREYTLHSLRNNKVDFIYLARLLLYLFIICDLAVAFQE